MQIVGEVGLGIDSSGPSCCLSAEHQKRWHRMSSLSCSLRQGWGGSVSIVKALFLSCPGYFYTTVSLLPHLTVQTCYTIMNITDSA